MGSPERIYLDNNATTKVAPEVAAAVIEELSGPPANPSSIHSFGQSARNQLVRARRRIATYFGVGPKEVVFTSGGTEALNLVLRGLPPGHIVTCKTEHSAVKETIESLGCPATWLDVGVSGQVSAEQVDAAIRPDTVAIAIMAANNETGVKQPIDSIAEVAEGRQIPLLVDGVAMLGKERFAIPAGVSAICFSGHKIHAPKGIGCALICSRQRLAPQLTGGSQEYGRRAGTENLGGALGLAEAVDLLEGLDYSAIGSLRDRLEQRILEQVPKTVVNGTGARVCNTTNISFLGIDVEALMMSLDMEGIAVSHASACASGSLEPSHVILGMGLGRERAMSSLRFSLSRYTTGEEIDRAAAIVIDHANRLHEIVS